VSAMQANKAMARWVTFRSVECLGFMGLNLTTGDGSRRGRWRIPGK
jgi:hypothetical protein